MQPPAPTPTAPRRIVVRGVNWLGDAVMSTPALLRLRQAFPAAYIVLLTPAKIADLWRHHPAVDTVLSFESGASLGQVARQIRDGRFDLGLVLPNSPRSALELWRAGVPRRVGYAARWRRWFLTQAVPSRPGFVAMHKRTAAEVRRLIDPARPPSPAPPPPPPTAHHLHHYLHLVAALGADPTPLAPLVQVTPEELTAARQRFALTDQSDSPAPWLGLNPGAEYGPAKRWPAEAFAAAAAALHRRTGCRWIILGGARDGELAAAIAAQISASAPAAPLINLAGRTSLRELAAVLKLCRVVLTNDTGPMHLAAAVGTPVVVPFGSTSFELTGPGQPGDPRHRCLHTSVACRPCFLRHCPIDRRCLTGITVDQVVQAVTDSLASPPR